MPVSGLVLTLSEVLSDRQRAIDALKHEPAIHLGPIQGHRVPIVLDTPSSDADKTMWEWLHMLPGILFVDLVSTDSSADDLEMPDVTGDSRDDAPISRRTAR